MSNNVAVVYIRLCYLEDEHFQLERSAIGGSASVCATIVNESDEEIQAQRLQVVPCKYFYPSSSAFEAIPSYSQKDVIIQLRGRNASDITGIPDKVIFRLSKNGFEQSIALCFGFFAEGLRQYVPEGLPGADGASRFNVLLFGLAGSSKSSFSNSVLTLMGSDGKLASPEFIIHRAH